MVFGHQKERRCQHEVEDFQFPVGIRWCSDLTENTYNPKVDNPGDIFQFPVGIRWCSDPKDKRQAADGLIHFQFPVGIRWCSDFISLPYTLPIATQIFQFPVGIRWCSDPPRWRRPWAGVFTFNSLWELDDVRTQYYLLPQVYRTYKLSIPCGN